MKKITFLFVYLFCAFAVQAITFTGAEMWYEYLGGCNYRIYQTTYLDCSSASMLPYVQPISSANPYPNPTATWSTVSVTGIGGTAPTLSGIWNLVNWQEVSPFCPSVSTMCNNSGATYSGVASVTYYTDYNLCNTSCTSVIVSWSSCCLNYMLSSGGAGNVIYQDIQIDLVNAPNNSSPYFIENVPTFIEAGQVATLSQIAYDADCDSLVYSLATCLSGVTTTLYYSAGYSPTSPLGLGWGVAINSSTGELTFTPIPSAGNGPIVAGVLGTKVEEYRNGNLIGRTQREMSVFAVAPQSPNAPPICSLSNLTGGYLSGNRLHVAANLPCSFDLTCNDSDPGQVLHYLSTLSSFFPISSITGLQNTNPMQLHVSFTPNISQMGKCLPLYIDIVDNHCSVEASSPFYHLVSVSSLGVSETISPALCGQATGAIALSVTGGTPPYTFSWSNGSNSQNINNLYPGAYLVSVSDALNDTWLGGPYYLNSGNFNTTFNTYPPDCYNTTGAIAAYTTNGLSPYSYTWNTGQITDSLTGLAGGGYSVNVTDANGCFEHEVMLLNFNQADSCTSTIKGRLYYDTNSNCVQDSWEPSIAYGYIDLSPGGAILTDSLGDYCFTVLDTGNFVLTFIPPYYNMGNTSSFCLPNLSQSIYLPFMHIDTLHNDFPIQANPDLAITFYSNIFYPGALSLCISICSQYKLLFI